MRGMALLSHSLPTDGMDWLMGLTRAFKRADAGDAGLVVAFETEVTNGKLYGRPLDHDDALSEISGNQYYLLFVDECLVATGALRWREDASAYLSNIAVLPGRRRQGLGRGMMNHLLSLCAQADTVDLAVHHVGIAVGEADDDRLEGALVQPRGRQHGGGERRPLAVA